MQTFEQPKAGQVTASTPIRSATPPLGGTTPFHSALRAVADWLRRSIDGWRARRNARRQLESWLTMDPRLLADIGVQRADVHAAVYGVARLADRGGRWAAPAGAKVLGVRCRTPQLRGVTGNDLDAAA